MHPGNRANDGEAQSMILVAVATRRVYTEKTIEDMGQACSRNRFASVDHREFESSIFFRRYPDHDCTPVIGISGCIIQ